MHACTAGHDLKSGFEYRFFRWNDLILVLAVLTVILVHGTNAEDNGGNSTLLQVSFESSSFRLELPKDTTLQVRGNLGMLEIQVEGTMARISSSPCPGQDCVHQGWIDEAGEMVVCVPSGVFMVLSHDTEASRSPDAVTY